MSWVKDVVWEYIAFILLTLVKAKMIVMYSDAQLCPSLWDSIDVACQAPLSMEFSRQEYWSGLPFPSPGDLPNPGIEPSSLVSPALQVDSLPLVPPGKPPEWLINCTLKFPHLVLSQWLWWKKPWLKEKQSSFPFCMLSCVKPLETPWNIASQTPLTTEFYWQEYWSGLPSPRPGELPDLGPHLRCLLHWPANSLPLDPLGSPHFPRTLGKSTGNHLLCKTIGPRCRVHPERVMKGKEESHTR